MSDNNKRAATKRYQNSDYPSGSFEAAISGEPSSGLHLVREPSLDGRSQDDLEEMVPAFMHRDFFRTEEDDSDPVPPPTAPRTPTISSPAGYVEPPNTEDIEQFEQEPAGRPSLPTSVIPPAAKTGTRPSPAKTGTRPSSAETGTRPSPAKPAARVPASQLKVPPVENRPVEPVVPSEILGEEPPLAPLRSHEVPAPPEPPRQASTPARSAAPESAPPASAVSNSSVTAYSLPLLAALAMVLGVFVWRETTRPVIVSQPLPIPQTATVADPSDEPSSAAPGFQPSYISVGPAVPPQTDPSGSPTPAGGEAVAQEAQQQDNPAGLFPGASAQTQDEDPDAQERSAMLEHMTSSSSSPSQAAESAPVRANSQNSSNPAALFPTVAAPEPAATKPVAAKPPAPKPPAAKPVNRPSAAELFPIDEEVPVRRPSISSPVVTQPVEEQPLPPISTAPAPRPGEPYQIDEPNF